MKISIFPNFEKQGTERLLARVLEILMSKGAECYVPIGVNAECNKASEKELYSLCDIVITIGGDGTLLRCAKVAAEHNKPCLGINTGRLGFLANLEPNQVELLEHLFSGEYITESRMMLSVSVYRGDDLILKELALNDAVISSGRVARIADIALDVEEDVIEYVADGLIISTPSGSTAYSMSAGGPIIDPSVRCITVTPICSHSLTARPILSAETAVLSVRLMDSSRAEAFLTVDGQRCGEVDFGVRVVIEKAPVDAKFINLSGSTIYKAIARKF